MDRRLGGEFGERADAPLERIDLLGDDLCGLFFERVLLVGVTYREFLHGEPDRRKRVLDLVRGLARQRLPALQAREVEKPFAVPLQLFGHPVERFHRGRDFALARRRQPHRQISGSDACVRFLQRYIATWRGFATDFELFRDLRSASFSWKYSATNF